MNHPEPEVQQLCDMAVADPEIAAMCRVVMREHGTNTVFDLFAKAPDVVFELHDEACSIYAQLGEPDL